MKVMKQAKDSRIPTMFGFDRSCGDFQVVVVKNGEKSGGIAVEYRQSIDSDEQSSHRASVPWKGGKLVDADLKSLLDDAKVPTFIQNSIWSSVFKAAEQSSQESQENKEFIRGEPSVLLKICSDIQTLDSDYQSEQEDD